MNRIDARLRFEARPAADAPDGAVTPDELSTDPFRDLEDDEEARVSASEHPVRAALARVRPIVDEQLLENPVRTLAVAAVVGFALGGGFRSRVGRFALLAVGRYAARLFMRDFASSALGVAVDADAPEAE